MCGLTGFFNTDGVPASNIVLRRMTDAIIHRGPDDSGYYIDGALALGHRRLAIIDLSTAGHQPMSTEDGRYVIAYNGEVYNYNELRIELESLGHRFYSHTDSEVVLKAMAQWGEYALLRFNGMFAFALWDTQERTLMLARDRYGIKPLYYTWVNNTLIFGSEIKAILSSDQYKTVINENGLLEYLTFQNFFSDTTLFKGVNLLPAGSTLSAMLHYPRASKPKCYWDYCFTEPQSSGDDHEYVEELDRLLKQAVSRQLVSDVDVGTYLSGGMDSGTVTALAATQLPYIKSFTCGFDMHSASGIELSYDERELAEHMSYLFKTEHYEMVLKAGDMERAMSKLAWHMEEPRVGQSYPNYYAAQLASKFVKVILSGTGGDEIFAGYPWRYYRAVVNNDFDHYIDKYYNFWQRLIPNEKIKDIFSPISRCVDGVNTRDIFKNVFAHHASDLTRPEDYINHSLYFEAKTFLHSLLVVEDKLSMAHSLETRVPFLDNDLVDFAMKIPTRLKLGNLKDVILLNENDPGPKTSRYFEKMHDGKLILRQVMSRYLPTRITQREKQGFSAPDASWFKGESINYVKKKLYTSNSPIYDFLDKKSVLSLVDEHIDGKNNRRLLIWSLLSLDECFKHFF